MPKTTKKDNSIAAKSFIEADILDVLNGRKKLEDTKLPSVPEDFYVLKCETTGVLQGDKISSWIFLDEAMNKKSMAKTIAGCVSKLYQKRLTDKDITTIADKLQKTEDRFGTLCLRNISFSFRWMSASAALFLFIVSRYGEFIFEHLITGNDEQEKAFYAMFPKGDIDPQVMRNVVTYSIAGGMKKRAHGAMLLAENAVRLPLDNLIYNFFLTANNKEWITVTDSEFDGNWWMCARQMLANSEQVLLLRRLDRLEKAGEKVENDETRHLLDHMLWFAAVQALHETAPKKYLGIRKEAKDKSFSEKLQMLLTFFEDYLSEPPTSLSDLHRWSRSIIFSFSNEKKEVTIFMMFGPDNVLEIKHKKMLIGRFAVKDFIDPDFMKKFFGEYRLYGEIPEEETALLAAM